MQFQRGVYDSFCQKVDQFAIDFSGIDQVPEVQKKVRIEVLVKELAELKRQLGPLKSQLEKDQYSADDASILIISAVFDDLNTAENTLNTLDGRIKRISQTILQSEARAQASSSSSSRENPLQQSSTAFQKKVEDFERRCQAIGTLNQATLLERELSDLNQELLKLQKQLGEAMGSASDAEFDRLLRVGGTLGEVETKLKDLAGTISDRTVEIVSSQTIVQPSNLIPELNAQIEELNREIDAFEQKYGKALTLEQIELIGQITRELARIRDGLAALRERLQKEMQRAQVRAEEEKLFEIFVRFTAADDKLNRISNALFQNWHDMIEAPPSPKEASSSSSSSAQASEAQAEVQVAARAVKKLADQIFEFNKEVESFNKQFTEWNTQTVKDARQKEKLAAKYKEHKEKLASLDQASKELSTTAKQLPQYRLLAHMLALPTQMLSAASNSLS